MPEFKEIHAGHGHYPEKRQHGPPGFCSAGNCSAWSDWRPSTATETQTQTEAIGSYTTTLTMTLSSVTIGGTVTSTTDPSLVSSITSETSSIPRITPSSTATHSSSKTSSSPFLSINTTAAHNGTSTPSPHGGTVAGIALGSAGAIALLVLICCICCRRRKKSGWSFNYKKESEENEELKKQLKEAAEIQAERNKALRALENRRTGIGSDGAFLSSPKHSTGFSGLRRDP